MFNKLGIFNANQTSMCLDPHQNSGFGLVPLYMLKPSSVLFTNRSNVVLFCGSLLLFMFHVCLYHTVLSVPCSLAVICWERADLFPLLSVMFPSAFVTFPYGISGQMWYLIVSIPDLCLYILNRKTAQVLINLALLHKAKTSFSCRR